jgi:hypothetical protein
MSVPFPCEPCPGGDHTYDEHGNAVCFLPHSADPCAEFVSAGFGPEGDYEHSTYCRVCGQESAYHYGDPGERGIVWPDSGRDDYAAGLLHWAESQATDSEDERGAAGLGILFVASPLVFALIMILHAVAGFRAAAAGL